jgi:hypothetical protein
MPVLRRNIRYTECALDGAVRRPPGIARGSAGACITDSSLRPRRPVLRPSLRRAATVLRHPHQQAETPGRCRCILTRPNRLV